MAALAAESINIKIDYKKHSLEHIHQMEKIELRRVRSNLRITNPVGRKSLMGKIIKFGVADGCAQYMIISTCPIMLQHIAFGDAYKVHPALIIGLSTHDIKQLINWD